MRLKTLEEENKDLRSKVASLFTSNERLKTELLNRAKTEKLTETRKYHDTKYKSKYSKPGTNSKVKSFNLKQLKRKKYYFWTKIDHFDRAVFL